MLLVTHCALVCERANLIAEIFHIGIPSADRKAIRFASCKSSRASRSAGAGVETAKVCG